MSANGDLLHDISRQQNAVQDSTTSNRTSPNGITLELDLSSMSRGGMRRPPLAPSHLDIPIIPSPTSSPSTVPASSPTAASVSYANGSIGGSIGTSSPISPTSILQKEKSPSLKRVSISEYTIEIPSPEKPSPGSIARSPSGKEGRTKGGDIGGALAGIGGDGGIAMGLTVDSAPEEQDINGSLAASTPEKTAIRTASFTSNCSNLRSSAATNQDEYDLYDLDDMNFEDSSNIMSFISLAYLNRVFTVGNKKGSLDLQDLGGISPQDRSELLYERFVDEYKKEISVQQVHRRSLWKAIWRTIGTHKLRRGLLLAAFAAALQFGPINILTRLVRHFQGLDDYSESDLWIMVAFLFICPFLASIAQAHSNVIMGHIGAGSRNVLINAIYRKSLKISSFARQKLSAGHIITMFSDDTNQIRNYINSQMTILILAPFQIAVCLYFIYGQVQDLMFIGLGYSLLTIPLMGVVVGIVFRIRSLKINLTDRRVKLINEVLSGIRIIKYYAWEDAFVKMLRELRNEEISALMKMAMLFQSVGTILLMCAPQIQILLIFITMVSQGDQLDAAKAFTLIALFGIMLVPFTSLPVGLQQFNQSKVAMNRIFAFLGEEEMTSYVTYKEIVPAPMDSDNKKKKKESYSMDINNNRDDIMDIAIEFKNFCASWNPVTSESVSNEMQEALLVNKADSAYQELSVHDDVTDVESPNPGGLRAELVDTDNIFSNRADHTLRNLNLKIKQGQLIAIIGSVGSGKSSLLSAILGEMYRRQGELILAQKRNLSGDAMPLSIAYYDQRAWIVNATLKENILFGKVNDDDWFEEVIYSACMEDDVDVLAGGVETEIGERGINLSGGQKARVSLARAVYSDADVYLLDDPLSAVDAHVGRHIFKECIKGTLDGKTRLLVTHQLHILPQCDGIIIIDNDGTLKAAGSYEEIMASGIDVEKYINAEEDNQDAIDDAIDALDEEGGSHGFGGLHAQSFFMKQPPSQLKGYVSGTLDGEDEELFDNLMSKEDKNEGNISLSVVWTYIKIGGPWLFLASVLCQVFSQVFLINSNFWLADWGEETTIDNLFYRRDMTEGRALYWYKGYSGMIMGGFVTFVATRLIFTWHRGYSTRIFHDKLLEKILFMPISFFDVTPVGRILNRFSQDIATIDEDLPMTVIQVITTGITTVGYFAGIAGATKGTLLILAVPLIFLYYQFQSFFRKPNTAIARLEAISRSPIYADFSQTLSGASTIRAYGQQDRFISTLETYANKNTVPGVMQHIAGQWLAIRLDLLGALIMFFMGALTVSLKDNDFIPAKYLGLGLSYSIQLAALMKILVRTMAIVEAHFNSVERIKQYIELAGAEERNELSDVSNNTAQPVSANVTDDGTRKIPESKKVSDNDDEEDDFGYDDFITGGDIEMNMLDDIQGAEEKAIVRAPPSDWPSHGRIRFENVSMRYREGPLVIKDVSFEVNAMDKIGIAGRTGCGKSSLMVALFRVEELSGGKIFIDDIDIATVPLKTLRSKLCIIPQEPVMFSSTVRFNLDPFDEFSNEEVWEVLRSVNMFDHIQSLPNKLEELVSEGGDNFSAGQRQLICIARAILRKPKVLVMDEATASIDAETDVFIQTMIRTKFAECTVLTIAHRLHTIIDSTKVLVMDKGFAKEYDAPQSLLAQDKGLFKALWERHVREGGELTPMGSPQKK